MDSVPTGSNSTSPTSKKRRRSTTAPPSEDARAGLLSEALHLLQRSQAVGESGIEALNGEEGVQELDNTIVGADATIKAWRFMQVRVAASLQVSFCTSGGPAFTIAAVSSHTAAFLLCWQLIVTQSCYSFCLLMLLLMLNLAAPKAVNRCLHLHPVCISLVLVG